MPEVLGPEYGALAGRTPEEALKLTMSYATDLENKLGYDAEGDPPKKEEPTDTLAVVRGMNAKTKEPITTEFVGNRSAAKAAARLEIGQEADPSFDSYDAWIEQVMSNMSADQQTDSKNWVEAYWFVWGQAQRLAKQNAEKEPGEDTSDTPPVTQQETVIHDSRVNAARGTPRGRNNVADQFVIEDADERRTKMQFERILGKKMSNEEWHRLQHDDIRTLEEYEDLQEDLKQRSG